MSGYVTYVDTFGSHGERFCAWWHYIDIDPNLMTTIHYTNTVPCASFNAVGEGDSLLVIRPKKQ